MLYAVCVQTPLLSTMPLGLVFGSLCRLFSTDRMSLVVMEIYVLYQCGMVPFKLFWRSCPHTGE